MSFTNQTKNSSTFDNVNISNVALWDDSEATWDDEFAQWNGDRTIFVNQETSGGEFFLVLEDGGYLLLEQYAGAGLLLESSGSNTIFSNQTKN